MSRKPNIKAQNKKLKKVLNAIYTTAKEEGKDLKQASAEGFAKYLSDQASKISGQKLSISGSSVKGIRQQLAKTEINLSKKHISISERHILLLCIVAKMEEYQYELIYPHQYVIHKQADNNPYEIEKKWELYYNESSSILKKKERIYKGERPGNDFKDYIHFYLKAKDDIDLAFLTIHVRNAPTEEEKRLLPGLLLRHNDKSTPMSEPILLVKKDNENVNKDDISKYLYLYNNPRHSSIKLLDISEIKDQEDSIEGKVIKSLSGNWWYYSIAEHKGKNQMAYAHLRIEPKGKIAYVELISDRADYRGFLTYSDVHGDLGNVMYMDLDETRNTEETKRRGNIRISFNMDKHSTKAEEDRIKCLYLDTDNDKITSGKLVLLREKEFPNKKFSREEAKEKAAFFELEDPRLEKALTKEILDDIKLSTIALKT